MQDAVVVPESFQPLGQGARVVDTFIAPRKTFTDLLRSSNCWLALVLIAVFAVGYGAVVGKKVGFATVQQVQLSKSPARQAQIDAMPPEQRAKSMEMGAKVTGIFTYVSFIFIFIVMALEGLVLWGIFNFALGASTKFSQVFAVIAFSSLPRALLLPLLSCVLLFAGVGVDNFDIRNPVGTNLGYYMQDGSHWMATAGTFFDVFGLWSLGLMVLGMAVISRKSIAQSATVVVGLWLLILIVVTGVAAI